MSLTAVIRWGCSWAGWFRGSDILQSGMDGKEYLKSYGWKEGEALKAGGLRKPILVKHKKDKKGLGGAPGQTDGEAWWERLFDGHLKNLDVGTDVKGGEIVFKQKEVVASGVMKQNSPLYRWFVQGESLKGTIESRHKVESVTVSIDKKKKKKKKSSSKIEKHSKKHGKSKDKHKKKHKSSKTEDKKNKTKKKSKK